MLIENKITENGVTKQLYYIAGGDGLAALLVKQSGQTDKIYYAHTDHLGSILKLTDNNGTAVFNASYDAWGKQTVTTNTIGFHRGYTGHEHLTEFGLINMNGRMYDPLVGRFLSPDPFVQMPDYSQNFNRYAYCLNNPLIYTDPSGEKVKWWQWLIGDVVSGGLISTYMASIYSLALGRASMSWFIGSVNEDFGVGKARFQNSWRISNGLFKADEDKSSWNQFWQIISRHTWQQPMTVIGYEFGIVANNIGFVDNVGYFHGATVLFNQFMEGSSAISMGGYIMLNPAQGGLNYDNTLLLHEYGHFLQVRQWGGFAFVQAGLFSLASAGPEFRSVGHHQNIWTERDANARTRDYFESRMTNPQILNFDNDFSFQQYYNWKFYRNLIVWDFFHLLTDDITKSN